MTGSIASPWTGSPAAAKAPSDRTLLLLLPAVAMLVLMFFVPMVLFFVRTFMEFHRSGQGPVVLTALFGGARDDQLDCADRHAGSAAGRVSDRLLPDDRKGRER